MNAIVRLTLIFVAIFALKTTALNCNLYMGCETCAAASDGCGWCLMDKKCSTLDACGSSVFLQNDAYNCPRSPNPKRLFNDTFGRETILPMVAAAYGNDPSKCLRKLETAHFYQNTLVPCDSYNKSDYCYSYTAYDLTRKAVIIGFRGTSGNFETVAEVLSILKKKDDFLGVGKVYDYFNNGFLYLWQAGLGEQVRTLRKVYPNYDVYVVGHSLGGSLASLCAAYLVKQKIFASDQVKMVTFGQPRTGDMDYATWHDDNIIYSYRLVHRHDPIPHIPPHLDNLMHHRFEIWYNNDMKRPEFSVCPYGDLGNQCADSQFIWIFDDHLHYYNTAVSTWGTQGCP